MCRFMVSADRDSARLAIGAAQESPWGPTTALGVFLLAASRRPIHRTRSNITILRSLSALMIFSFGGLSPLSTMLIIEGTTPFFLAHSCWPPARFTSKRSKRTTSFWSSARMSVFRTGDLPLFWATTEQTCIVPGNTLPKERIDSSMRFWSASRLFQILSYGRTPPVLLPQSLDSQPG
jgi:hypothetical protein